MSSFKEIGSKGKLKKTRKQPLTYDDATDKLSSHIWMLANTVAPRKFKTATEAIEWFYYEYKRTGLTDFKYLINKIENDEK